MSYSRWSNSCWYSFWCDTTSKLLEEQVFALWYSPDEKDTLDWTYKQLRESLDNGSLLNDIMIKYNCTPKEAEEAFGYIERWIADMNDRLNIDLFKE